MSTSSNGVTASTTAAAPLPAPNDAEARAFLVRNAWPPGLREQFVNGLRNIPIRFVIVDNSGSMVTVDSTRMLTNGTNKRFVKCSRWAELTEAIKFHASLAEAARAPTEYRLLNNVPPVMVGCGDDNGQGCRTIINLLDQSSPTGGTPLCYHITEIVRQITALAPQLRANGQRAAVIIATDGEPSDGDIAQAMKPLQHLPVWVVIRLCTSEERVCEYWNNIDKQLEVDMDVLDDIESEAKDIRKLNGWFTYGEPLHHLREFGLVLKDMDLIDESRLATDQMRSVIACITTGGPASEIPHPDVDWKAFMTFVKSVNDSIPGTWCPLDKSPRQWIHMKELAKVYGKGKGECSIM